MKKEKIKYDIDWQKLDEYEKEETASLTPYIRVYFDWIKKNKYYDNPTNRENYRKCYSIYNNKKDLESKIKELYYGIGYFQNRINDNTKEILQYQTEIAKYKKVMNIKIKPENYEKFHCMLNNTNIKPLKNLKKIEKTEEFIFAYVVNNDNLFHRIKVQRILQGKN